MPDNKPGIKEYLNRTLEALLPLLGLPLALLLGAGMLLALKVNPLVAYSAMLEGAVGSVSAITQTLVKATPLLLVGLGIVIAYRGGVVNIGGEGQLLVGALAATALAIGMESWPRWLLMPAVPDHRRSLRSLMGWRTGHPQSPYGRERDPQHSDDELDRLAALELPAARPDDRSG